MKLHPETPVPLFTLFLLLALARPIASFNKDTKKNQIKKSQYSPETCEVQDRCKYCSFVETKNIRDC